MRQLIVAALGAIVMVSSFGEAFANPFRVPNATGTRTTFRMEGLTPGTEVQVGVGDTKSRVTAYTTNNYVRLSPRAGTTQFRLMGQTWINLSSATDVSSSIRVSTIQGQRQFVSAQAAVPLPNPLPSLMKIGNAFYWNPGVSVPSEGIFVEFNVPQQRVARVNACGQLSISVISEPGNVNAVNEITVGGTTHTIASLPIGNPANLSRCLKFGESTYVRYVPQ